MTFKGLGEMFEGDFADMCAESFLIMLMEGQTEGLACADPGARIAIRVSGNSVHEHYELNLAFYRRPSQEKLPLNV